MVESVNYIEGLCVVPEVIDGNSRAELVLHSSTVAKLLQVIIAYPYIK